MNSIDDIGQNFQPIKNLVYYQMDSQQQPVKDHPMNSANLMTPGRVKKIGNESSYYYTPNLHAELRTLKEQQMQEINKVKNQHTLLK